MDKFIQAMNYRHATKEFDSQKTIDENMIDNILEVGRLSPSSFGFEPWKFVVVENQALKEELAPACFNQKQITTGSHIIFILTKKEDMEPQSHYIKDLLSSRLSQEHVQKVMQIQEGLYNGLGEDKYDMWLKAQCYIPAANMMTYAAGNQIDSCPMEGFNEEEVLKTLNYDSKKYGVAMVVAFGYRADEPQEKTRLPIEEIVDFRK